MTHGPRPASRPKLAFRISLAGRISLASRISLAGALWVMPQVAMADDEIRTSADVASNVGYSSNPFSGSGHDLGSPYVQIDVRPVISLVAEHSALSLSGVFDYQHYFHRYSDSKDYGVGLDYTGTLSSRLTTHANVHYDSSIIGGFDSFAPVITPTLPLPTGIGSGGTGAVTTSPVVTSPTLTPLPITTGPDIALIGSRDRRSTFSVADDLSYSLSARDALNANAYYDRTHYFGIESGSDYSSYGGGVGYSRRMSARLQLGLQASASRYVYRGLLGDSKVYSLQATFRDQISDRWNVSGAVGASFSDQSLGGRRTNLTGNVQLCRLAPRSSLCVTASDAVLPTGGTGTVDSKQIGVGYTRQLTARSTFLLSAQYSHNDQPSFFRGINQGINRGIIADSYLTANASYDRQLRQRIHLVASTHYRRLLGNALRDTPADFGGSIGILVRFGDIR